MPIDLERLARRNADGLCLCCGAKPFAGETGRRLACGCWFCERCTERGHAQHDQRFAAPCPTEERS